MVACPSQERPKYILPISCLVLIHTENVSNPEIHWYGCLEASLNIISLAPSVSSSLWEKPRATIPAHYWVWGMPVGKGGWVLLRALLTKNTTTIVWTSPKQDQILVLGIIQIHVKKLPLLPTSLTVLIDMSDKKQRILYYR